MEKRRFGSTGVEVPILGQGTWNIEATPDGALAALRAGLDLGMTHVDTAEMYGGGEAERLVARAIAGRREEVFLASKVLPDNATFAGVLRACEASLERLQTSWLDLYLLHWPSIHPLEETVRAFEALVSQGKVRFWGVSNFDVDELERVVAIAGPGRVACDQVLYHLGDRYAENALMRTCARNGVALVAYSPFGSGDFPSPRGRGGRVLAQIARANGATPHQVALAYLVRDHPHLAPAARAGESWRAFAIPKASSSRHVEENAAAGSLALRPEEVARIDEAFHTAERSASLPVL